MESSRPNPTINTDAILPLFIAQSMPIGLSGLIIAAIFAAAMSSLDSAMHSTSTVIVTDFYKRFKPNLTETKQVKIAKLLIFVFGIIGTSISLLYDLHFIMTEKILRIFEV